MVKVHLIATIAITSLFLITLQWLTFQLVLRKDQTEFNYIWAFLYQISWIAFNQEIPLFLIDGLILNNATIEKTLDYCHVFCIDQRITHMAAIGEFADHRKLEKLTKALKEQEFTVIQFTDLDPTLIHHDLRVTIPLHLLIFKGNPTTDSFHVLHISIFYERLSKYWWIARLDPLDTHKPLLLRHQVRRSNFPSSDNSLIMEKFEIKNTLIDGLIVGMPSKPEIFMDSPSNLAFIECDKVQAKEYKNRFMDTDGDEYSEQFRSSVHNLLAKVKHILDEMEISFWLSSGTCLGYYRQCDIIPYTQDVDIGIFIQDYRPELIDQFFLNNIPLLHIFGKPEDSYELSFRDDRLKLDVFFFYEEKDFFWNGGTDAKTGIKYKYFFSKFQLCWTEFLDLLLRVPCDTLSYVKANYGSNWSIPIKSWDWRTSPSNVKANGRWSPEDWPKVIQLSPTSDVT